jgi:hypothetical protein
LPTPRAKITIRRMMIVVVVAGLLLGAYFHAERRRAYCSRKILIHTDLANDCMKEKLDLTLDLDRSYKAGAPPQLEGAGERVRMRKLDREVLYHTQMREKYQRAASHPWEALPTDVPNP